MAENRRKPQNKGRPRRTDDRRGAKGSDGRTSGGRGSQGAGHKGSGSKSSGSKNPNRTKGSGSSRQPRPHQREKLRTAGSGGGDLPQWIRDEIGRVTTKERRDATLALLGEAADQFADARYPAAYARLVKAKGLASSSPTIRELLGLTAYRMGKWEEALRELRAFRRIEGDTTHLAVEMDCLRALGRQRDVPKVWEIFRERGASKGAEVELRVVYGAHLLDEGDAAAAWKVTNPGRIAADAHENDLRQWYVASRAALALGDAGTARRLLDAIETRDLGFPGLEELSQQIAESETG